MYPFEIKQYKKTDDGVYLGIFVKDKEILNEIIQNKSKTGSIKLDDNRRISAKQQKRIYLTIKDIANYLGYFPKEAEQLLIENFNISYNENLTSIPECSMSLARKFLAYLLEFCLSIDVPLSDYATKRIDDLESYISLCLLYRKCAICGKDADIHHALDDRVQMGNNRNKINHVGRKTIPLCRTHHTQLHNMSENDFYKKYSIKPIPLTEEMVKKLGV
jgi:hypothetical protein